MNLLKNTALYEALFQQKERRKVAHLFAQQERPPIYHYHIRKTAGTSINFAFLAHYGGEDTEGFYQQLAQQENHRLIANDKVFVGWNTRLIQGGKYFYAFSHAPAHSLELPSNAFTLTCLRDPAQRVLSHYNMLQHYKNENIPTLARQKEGQWLGNSFDDFLDRLPKKHLQNQLYMFSPTYNVAEAVERIQGCSFYFFMEELEAAFAELSDKLDLDLSIFHRKKYGYISEISDLQMERLQEMLKPEYQMIDKLKDH